MGSVKSQQRRRYSVADLQMTLAIAASVLGGSHAVEQTGPGRVGEKVRGEKCGPVLR